MTRSRLTTFLLAAVLVVPSLAHTADAASGQPVPTVNIALTAQLILPSLIRITISYTCEPAPTSEGTMDITITQSSPLPAASAAQYAITCDGAGHTQQFDVYGGPVYSPGDALAWAQACTVLTCGTDSRKIVLE